MTIDLWTTADALKGLCEFEDVGNERPPRPPAPDTSTGDQQPATVEIDLDSVDIDFFMRTELAAYVKDPDRYRQQSASNLNKMLDLLARRQERDTNSRPDNRPVDQLSVDEITAKVLPSLRDMRPGFRASLSNGLDHLITQCVRGTRIVEAREIAFQILRHFDRCSGREP